MNLNEFFRTRAGNFSTFSSLCLLMFWAALGGPGWPLYSFRHSAADAAVFL
jgi:hypothetical protein